MKKYIYYIILIGIIIILTVVFSAWVGKLKAELLQANNTNQSFISGDTRLEKTITKVQFVTYYPKADSTFKSYGKKSKQLIKYIKIKETLTDTIQIRLHDTIIKSECQVFHHTDNCLNAFGIVQNDTVNLSYEYNNELQLFHYWSWQKNTFIKRLLSWNWDKFNSAIVVSSCSKDTLTVIDNIQIEKK